MGDEAQADEAGGQVDRGQHQECAPSEVVVRERAQHKATRIPRHGGRLEGAAGPRPRPHALGRRRGDRPQSGGYEGGGGHPLQDPGREDLLGMEGCSDQDQSQCAHHRAAHHEELAAQPVGETRQEGGEDHLADGLSGADQPDGRPVRMPVCQVGQVELDRHRRPGHGDPDQGGAGQEGGDRGLARIAEPVLQIGDNVCTLRRTTGNSGVGGMALGALGHDGGRPPGSVVRAIARVPASVTVRHSLTWQFWRQGTRQGRTPGTNPSRLAGGELAGAAGRFGEGPRRTRRGSS